MLANMAPSQSWNGTAAGARLRLLTRTRKDPPTAGLGSLRYCELGLRTTRNACAGMRRPLGSRSVAGTYSVIQAVSVNAVVSLDGAGHVTHFNPAAERTFGY